MNNLPTMFVGEVLEPKERGRRRVGEERRGEEKGWHTKNELQLIYGIFVRTFFAHSPPKASIAIRFDGIGVYMYVYDSFLCV